jgi:Mg2+ and Co2+ transporter CorA
VALKDIEHQSVQETLTSCFENDVQSCERLILALVSQKTASQVSPSHSHRLNSQNISNTKRVVWETLLRFILDDTKKIHLQLQDALDTINIGMSSDKHVDDFLGNWRDFFGRWRKGLSRQERSIAYILNAVRHQQTPESASLAPPQLDLFQTLGQDTESLRGRIESTFHALMSTMAILESRRAIAQAATISKLTNLAFFFIPLTLCASVFGMNIVVSWPTYLSQAHYVKK